MALEPITRQEKIIAGQDLTPITRMEKFLKQYGGGSGGVTSWNDLTDKPFGEVTTVKEVLAECQPEFVEQDGENGFVLEGDPFFIEGETYTVKWNGVDYKCTAVREDAPPDLPVPVYIGNVDKLYGTGDTGEPFVAMANYDANMTAFMPFDGSTSLTVSVAHHEKSIKKISGKYVEGMGYEEDGVVHPVDQKLLGTISGKHVEGMGYVDKEWASWSEKETLETYNSNDFGQVYAYLHVGEGKILEFGKTYRVSVNGETYVCVAEENKMAEPKYAMLYCKNSSGEVVYEIDDVNQDGTMTFIASGREKREVAIDISATFLEESTAEAYTHPTFGQAWLINSALKLTVGETYTVVYNGTEYKCVCGSAPAGFSSDPDAVAMGNFSAAGGADTGEPFAMLISNAQNRVDIIDLSDANSVKVKIYKGTIHPIDQKFLPSGGGGAVYYADEIGALFHDSSFTTPVSFEEARDAVDIIIRMVWNSETIDFYPAFKHVIPGHETVRFHCLDYNDSGNPVFKQYFAGVTDG